MNPRPARVGDADPNDSQVVRYAPLVHAMARYYVRPGLSFADLTQEGSLGLIDALARFDPDRGTSFAAYARHWVRHRLQSYVRRQVSLVPLPQTRSMRRAQRRLRRTKDELERRTGRQVSSAEIALELGVEIEEVALARLANSARRAPLDETHQAGAGAGREPPRSPEEDAARNELRDLSRTLVRTMLGRLDERERRIVDARWMSDAPCTLRELGEQLSLSAERVRQLELRAVRRMREALVEQGTLQTAQRCARQLAS